MASRRKSIFEDCHDRKMTSFPEVSPLALSNSQFPNSCEHRFHYLSVKLRSSHFLILLALSIRPSTWRFGERVWIHVDSIHKEWFAPVSSSWFTGTGNSLHTVKAAVYYFRFNPEAVRRFDVASRVARCSNNACCGYLNPLCDATNLKWTCSLCFNRNQFNKSQVLATCNFFCHENWHIVLLRLEWYN